MGIFGELFGKKAAPVYFQDPTQASPQAPVEVPFSFEIAIPEQIQLYFAAKTLDAQCKLRPVSPDVMRSFANYLNNAISLARTNAKTDADSKLIRAKLLELKEKFDAARESYLANIQPVVFEAVDHINKFHAEHGRSIKDIADRFAKYRQEMMSGRHPEHISHILMDLTNSVSSTTIDDEAQFVTWGITRSQAREMERYVSGHEAVIAPEHWESYLKIKNLQSDSWDDFISFGLSLNHLIR